MAINYFFSFHAGIETVKAEVTRTGYINNRGGGCSNPFAYIDIKGCKKQLIFPCGFTLEGCRFVSVKLKRGLFGFDRILEQAPADEGMR